MTHYSPLSAPVNSLLALAIGLALRLGLHQDPPQPVQSLSSTPTLSSLPTVAEHTSTEMRRRLWWHIMTLDAQYAEIDKTDPIISEAMWTTSFPGSFNDSELDESSERPMPPPPGETFDPATFANQAATLYGAGQENRSTDMSFALLRMELMHTLRRHGFSEHFCTNNGYTYLTTPAARIQFLEDLVQRVNQDYLQFRQGNDLLSFFERNAVKVMLSKHLMMAQQDRPVTDRIHKCAPRLVRGWRGC
jgi:hypothetical protein